MTVVAVLQEQMSSLQAKLDEEEHKNLKLQQHVDRLEHHSAQMQEVRTHTRRDCGAPNLHGRGKEEWLCGALGSCLFCPGPPLSESWST